MMRRIERIPESIFGLENSTVDSNRFYSILLDAKTASVSENMCDIAEKLLQGEKENAKVALEQLWSLKKNLVTETNNTVDLLINFYQDKMDILRTKEEHIKKVSRDSRNLLEEKRKRDEEFAQIKQQLQECNKELTELTARLEKLKTKEQELLLIEKQLEKELNSNENEIVNGLYEIILPQVENDPDDKTENGTQDGIASARDILSTLEKIENAPAVIPPKPVSSNQPVETDDSAAAQPLSLPQFSPYPKSVVKTTGGRVIGEYYYDNKVYKNQRHYIFNSKYFYEQLSINTRILKQRFDQGILSEMSQMIHDALKRITENDKLHFEVSTNEILNEKTLNILLLDTKKRSFDEIERFCSRLRLKIDALGSNYITMLREQMERCQGNS
ncbi:MAG: hypothetical protein GX640_00025 [Fibrobacter sp.]|nr:hypothetical protein [Fibrobacter sp.]